LGFQADVKTNKQLIDSIKANEPEDLIHYGPRSPGTTARLPVIGTLTELDAVPWSRY